MPDIAFFSGAIVFVALTAWALLGGADFGGGVWDGIASGPRAREQRELIAKAIGPIWEANHVWMIVVLVVIWVCFPPAYAAIGTALHVPLTLMLVGIVLRGTSFVFRTYDSQHDDIHRRWSLLFAVSSTITPVFLGICVGALASGRLRLDPDTLRPTVGFVDWWLQPFPIAVGLYSLGLFAFLAATYLVLDAPTDELREDFRVRGLASGAVTGLLAFVALGLAFDGAPQVVEGLVSSWWALPFHLLVSGLAVTSLGGLYTRRYRLARAGAVGLVVAVIVGWAAAQFPFIIPPDLTIDHARSPDNIQWMVVGAVGTGLLFLIPAFVWLFRVFGKELPLLPGDVEGDAS